MGVNSGSNPFVSICIFIQLYLGEQCEDHRTEKSSTLLEEKEKYDKRILLLHFFLHHVSDVKKMETINPWRLCKIILL